MYKVGLSAKVVSLDDEASLGDQEDASKQERKFYDIDVDEDITLDSTHFDTDPDMFRVHDLHGDEVFVETEEPVVNIATTTSTIPVSAAKDLSDVDITLAQALAELKNTKLKADKGKGIMVEELLKKKEQIRLNEELALKLQAEEEEQARLVREKGKKDEEANISWDNVQAIIEADRLLAERLQVRVQEELTDEEKAILFLKLLEKRKKHYSIKSSRKKEQATN
ncbi:hypothetical protein Tco_0830705 [Tanacetum coccineum]